MRWFGATLLIASACTQDGATVFLPLPDPNAEAIVLVIGSGTNAKFYAFEPISSRASLDMPIELGVEGTYLEALSYSSRLEVLGLRAGEILRRADGEPLPAQDGIYTATIRDEAASTWEPLTARGAESAELRLELENTPCVDFETNRIELGGVAEDVSFIVVIDDDNMIATTVDEGSLRGLYHVNRATSSRISAFPAGMPIRAAATAPNDQVWFAGEMGELWRGMVRISATGTASIDARLVSTSSSGEAIGDIVSSKTGEDLEVYTISTTGAFERYDGQSWEMLHNFGVSGDGALLRIGPRHTYALMIETRQLVEYVNGRVRDATPSEIVSPLDSMGYSGPLGLMVSSGQSETTLLATDGAWKPIPGRPGIRHVNAIQPLGDGFFLTGDLGATTQYYPGYGFCRIEQLDTSHIFHMATTTKGFIVGTHARTALVLPSVTWLDRL